MMKRNRSNQGAISPMAALVLVLILLGIVWAAGNLFPVKQDSTLFPFGMFTGNLEKQTVDQEQIRSLDGCDSIQIISTGTNVVASVSDSPELKARFHGTFRSIVSGNEPVLEISIVQQKMIIEVKKMNGILALFDQNTQLDICIPSSFTGDTEIGTVSGSIDADILTARQLKMHTVSGKIRVKSLKVKNDIKCTSVSGSISLEAVSGNHVSVQTTSGSIQVLSLQVMGTDIRSVSGNIHVVLPSASGFKLQATSLSGRIDCDFDLADKIAERGRLDGKTGDGNILIKLNTISGNIRVNKETFSEKADPIREEGSI
ncbi:MAG TPA: hypothetical protein DD727_05195 [Clostridiales bacterium]|nr:hypothetical protein [Clostridiales bacterium]